MSEAPTLISLRTLAHSVRFRQHPTLTACWLWTGRLKHGSNSLPMICVGGVDRSARLSIWQRLRGAKYVGQLRPDCGQQLCVNPSHMRVSA